MQKMNMADETKQDARHRDNYLNKIRKFAKDKKLCEIETIHGVIAVGCIQDVGRDYFTIIRQVERTIKSMEESEGEEGKQVSVEHIEVLEFETILRLTEVTAISQIVKRTIK